MFKGMNVLLICVYFGIHFLSCQECDENQVIISDTCVDIVYVNGEGEDSEGCGVETSPCKSVVFSISVGESDTKYLLLSSSSFVESQGILVYIPLYIVGEDEANSQIGVIKDAPFVLFSIGGTGELHLSTLKINLTPTKFVLEDEDFELRGVYFHIWGSKGLYIFNCLFSSPTNEFSF
jgi:hypothetical protein